MAAKGESVVVVDQSDPTRGRIDRARFGKRDPSDVEPYPATDFEDAEATRLELLELRRRMDRKSA